jgi:ketosteroid isomerase-like protein
MTNEIEAVVRERVAAVHAKDLATLAAREHPDVHAYNLLPPLQLHGAEEVLAQTRTWFASYPGTIGYEIRDLHVDVDGDLGYAAFLYQVSGTLASGDEVSMWVRATVVLRRDDGAARRWRIVHDHESVPFDPETGLARLDLQP